MSDAKKACGLLTPKSVSKLLVSVNKAFGKESLLHVLLRNILLLRTIFFSEYANALVLPLRQI